MYAYRKAEDEDDGVAVIGWDLPVSMLIIDEANMLETATIVEAVPPESPRSKQPAQQSSAALPSDPDPHKEDSHIVRPPKADSHVNFRDSLEGPHGPAEG